MIIIGTKEELVGANLCVAQADLVLERDGEGYRVRKDRSGQAQVGMYVGENTAIILASYVADRALKRQSLKSLLESVT